MEAQVAQHISAQVVVIEVIGDGRVPATYRAERNVACRHRLLEPTGQWALWQDGGYASRLVTHAGFDTLEECRAAALLDYQRRRR